MCSERFGLHYAVVAACCCTVSRKLLLEALEEAAPEESRVMSHYCFDCRYCYYSTSDIPTATTIESLEAFKQAFKLDI